jgi:DNA repair protein RecN (Recombination protein N)
MLRYLNIRNLAVIEAVEIEFGPGFTVLTGETGAGKSILVEAVGLLLGGRASSDLVRTGEEAAQIQAVFETAGGHELIVRREVTAQGRSRAFIDGALATAAALRDLSEALIELHGQHEHHLLLETERHLDLLDAYAGLQDERAAAARAFDELQRHRMALDALRLDERQKAARIDLLTFQHDEIVKAALTPGEEERLLAERQRLANADRLQRIGGEAYAALYEADGAALGSLALVWRKLGELAPLDSRVAPYLDARDAIKSQLEDLAFFLREYTEEIDASPARLQAVEDRLAALTRLKRKYGDSVEEIAEHGARCARELADLAELDARTAEAERAHEAARHAFESAAGVLSAARRDAAARLSRALESALAELAMGGSRFDVRMSPDPLPAGEWSPRGFDAAEFFVSPNVGEELRPLAKVASGGELSRIMLALRGLTIPAEGDRTLIFDEVDAGIGGRAADDVGRKLQRLGRQAQVLCITHLPHIAACASAHLRVSKNQRLGRTVTEVSALDADGRRAEIARMMAGASVTPAVLASAAEMLASRGESESSSKAKAKVKGARR